MCYSVISAGVFPTLVELLRTGEFDIQKEAAWAVSNATSGGTPDQIRYLVQLVSRIVFCLSCVETSILTATLLCVVCLCLPLTPSLPVYVVLLPTNITGCRRSSVRSVACPGR